VISLRETGDAGERVQRHAGPVRTRFGLSAAISARFFYGFAGVRHVLQDDRSRNQTIAMVSDLGIALLLAAFVAST
jgi:hypothetical protein